MLLIIFYFVHGESLSLFGGLQLTKMLAKNRANLLVFVRCFMAFGSQLIELVVIHLLFDCVYNGVKDYGACVAGVWLWARFSFGQDWIKRSGTNISKNFFCQGHIS